MINFGKITGAKAQGNKVFVSFEKKEAIIEVICDSIINVFVPFDTKEHNSKAIDANKAKKTEFTFSFSGNAVTLSTETVTAKIYKDLKIDFYTASGEIICRDYRGKMQNLVRMSEADAALMAKEGHRIQRAEFDKKINVVKRLERGEVLYGLGDKAGFMDKRGYEYVMWNTDTTAHHDEQMPSLYKSIPFYISKKKNGKKYGIFFDNTHKSVFNMGKDSPDYLWYGAYGGNLDYYFIYGTTLADIVTSYTYLTGRAPLPQRWTLGYHQSRWGYVDEADVNYISSSMRENKIPCDAIHLDIDYMDNYKIFTWDKNRYKNPKKTVDNLRKNGFKVINIVDPGIKVEKDYDIYEEGLKKGFFATDSNGLPYVNAVWPGDSLFPDFGSPDVREWWGENLRFYSDMGTAGIWNDMNEPASFRGELPEDVVFSDENRKTNHAEMHNVYGHNMSRATYEGIKKHTGKRPFVITRACYAGSQKYAAAWTGDNRSVWAHLRALIPQLCSLGMCGMPIVGTDIGGFMQDTTPELLLRWVEAAVFSPLFRNHCNKGSRYQEPWRFGKETLDIYRKFVELRYAFIPYLYDLLFEEEKTGLPVMRPLALHYENDTRAERCNNQFLVGKSLMCAPVIEQGALDRSVYLPKGEWYDVNTGKKIKGGKSIVANAPIDTLPLYAKAGAVLPNYEPMQYIGEKPLDTLILRVFKGEGTYTHYQDNGEDFAYRDGGYNKYEFTVSGNSLRGRLTHEGYDRKYKKIIVVCDGKSTTVKNTQDFEVKL